jgi:hypothetical protein
VALPILEAMRCERCGRVLNRATGRCVCEEDPSAVPVAVGAAGMAPIEPVAVAAGATPSAGAPAATPAGWYPDPAGSSGLRYWDGDGWSEHLADAPPSAPVVHGVIPRVRKGGKVYDLHLFRDRIVLTRVPGADPETLGMLIGFFAVCGLLGAVIGQAVGRVIAKNASAARIGVTSWSTADELVAGGGEAILHSSMTSFVARHHGSGGRMRIELAGQKPRKLSWTKAHVKELAFDRLLHEVLPGRAVVHPVNPVRVIGRWVGLALLVLLFFGAIFAAVVADPAAEDPLIDEGFELGAGPSVAAGAVEPLGRACAPWSSLGQDGADATIEQIQMVLTATAPDFDQAAAADASLQPAADAIGFLRGYFALPSEQLQPQVETAAATVDEACARA